MRDEQGNIENGKISEKKTNQGIKNICLNLYSYIVGAPYGWGGEGNEQWYYFLALVMNCMLTWWLKPELGILITICSAVHFGMTIIYGLEDLVDPLGNDGCFIFSVLYFAIHLIMFITCICFNWWWALLTSAIVVVAYLIAPDCSGFCFLRNLIDNNGDYLNNDNIVGIMISHTIWFACFVTITLLLPISIWIRIAIIAVCMILHPFIDLYEGDCVIISDLTDDAFNNIMDKISSKK